MALFPLLIHPSHLKKNSVSTFKSNYHFLGSCGFTPPVRFPPWMFGGFELSLILGINIRGQDKNYEYSSDKQNYLEFLASLPEHFLAFKQDMTQYRSYINDWWHLCGAESLLTKAGHPVSMPVTDSPSLISKMLSRGFTDRSPKLPPSLFDEIVDNFEAISNFNEAWISPHHNKLLKFTGLGEFTPVELRSLAHKRALEKTCSPVQPSTPKRSPRI